MDTGALLAALALPARLQRGAPPRDRSHSVLTRFSVLISHSRAELERQGGAAVGHALLEARALVAEGSNGSGRRLQGLADTAYERCWERLHCGGWKDVAPAWREAFGAASVLKVTRAAGCELVVTS